MITFPEILKAVEEQYHFSACFIADHLHIEDEIVEGWEKGTILPSEKEAKDFADLFAIPSKLVLDSIQKGNNEK